MGLCLLRTTFPNLCSDPAVSKDILICPLKKKKMLQNVVTQWRFEDKSIILGNELMEKNKH